MLYLNIVYIKIQFDIVKSLLQTHDNYNKLYGMFGKYFMSISSINQ